MARDGQQYLLGAWWLTAVPGITFLTVSLAFNLLDDRLRRRSHAGGSGSKILLHAHVNPIDDHHMLTEA